MADPIAPSMGTRLGVYQLEERIGAGGMGEVYRARDTRLSRAVAIKLLSSGVTRDAGRLARVEREAQALAALNHPNIATIYGVEDHNGVPAIVMELIEGPTLAERLASGALTVRETLAVAGQVADALDAAHEKGIIHRDLKPANIKFTVAGAVKVLDFGLAKVMRDDVGGAQQSQLTTQAANDTREGLIVGTAAYMSPEQARGQPVDKRTDIWAFGCVVYEMLTGHGAFARATMSDTIASILERDADLAAIPADAPLALSRLITRCLTKDARRRLRDAGDARAEIEDMQAGAAPSSLPARSSDGSRRHWGWAIAGFVCAGLIAAGIARFVPRNQPPAERPAQFTLSFGGQMTDIAAATVPVPSPDGRYFVFVGTNEQGGTSLWTRPLESADTRPLQGTAGAENPIWSPDGRSIGFYADGKLKKVSVSGGQPQTIASLEGFQEATWGSQGDIIFRASNRDPLLRISESGGTPTPLTRLNADLAENSHRGPTFLPDGRRFLFTARSAVPENGALYLGSLDTGEVRRVMSLQSKTVYLPSRNGHPPALLYYRDGGLEARAFDADTGRLAGERRPVLAGVDYNAGGIAAAFQASADGRVIVASHAGGNASQLTWFDRTGEQTGILGGPGDFLQPRISPQGDRVAFTRADAKTGNRDVWSIDIARGVAARVTVNPANDWNAVWSPDGKQMVFGSDRRNGRQTDAHLKKSLDTTGDESSVLQADGSPSDWSRDTRWIAYNGAGSTGSIKIVSTGDRTTIALPATTFLQGNARFSPDGRWLAYTSNETGRVEVFVRPFDGSSVAAEDKVQLSDGGGDFPVWRSDGQELFYLSGDFQVHSVETSRLQLKGPVPRPQRLFRACPNSVTDGRPLRGTWWAHPFDTLDGKRFLINCTARPPGQFVVLMNWAPPSRQ